MQLQKKHEYLLDVFFISIFIALIINLVSPELQKYLEQQFITILPHVKNAYLIFVVFSAVITLSVYIYIKKTLSKDSKQVLQQSIEDRNALIESLNRRYTQRLKKKMDNDIKLTMELELRYTDEGTDKEFIRDNYIEQYKLESAGDFEKLFQSYEEKIYRLLIIGDPGSGKSTLLLRFANKLIESARSNNNFPIPIILNLSSWRSEYETFINWLEQNLVYFGGEFGTSKEYAKILANSYNIILLLDGLDEIPLNHRADCLKKLKKYLSSFNQNKITNYPEVIIVCRREEYKEILVNAPVQASINIEPINPAMLNIELDNIIDHNKVRKNAANDLKILLARTPMLNTLLSTAFHLHIALSLITEEYDLSKIQTQDELVRLYVNKETAKIYKKYSKEITNNTLNWLSKKMTNSRKGITFELTDIQPTWLKNKWIYLIIISIFKGLLYVIVISIFREIVGTEPVNKYFIFFIGFITTLVTDSNFNIKTGEIKELKFVKLNIMTIIWLLITSLLIVIFLVFLFLLGGKIYGLNIGYRVIVVMAIFVITYLTSLQFIKETQLPNISRPYKRLTFSFLFDTIQLTFCFFITFFLYNYLYKVYDYKKLIIGLIVFGFTGSIIFSPLLKYIIVQLILYFEKLTPLNFARFLNIVSEDTGLIERDGGQWRFRHKLIQEECLKTNN